VQAINRFWQCFCLHLMAGINKRSRPGGPRRL
jgi:hypothetical protein